jgi:ABC-type uncharacterized transport system substrate-binding protein
LLKETLPNLSRVGILWNPDNWSRLTSMRETTQALGLTLVPFEERGLNALEQAFATMVRERAQEFVVPGCPIIAARLESWPSEIDCQRGGGFAAELRR